MVGQLPLKCELCNTFRVNVVRAIIRVPNSRNPSQDREFWSAIMPRDEHRRSPNELTFAGYLTANIGTFLPPVRNIIEGGSAAGEWRRAVTCGHITQLCSAPPRFAAAAEYMLVVERRLLLIPAIQPSSSIHWSINHVFTESRQMALTSCNGNCCRDSLNPTDFQRSSPGCSCCASGIARDPRPPRKNRSPQKS